MNLNQLIQNAIDADACKEHIYIIKKYRTFRGLCKSKHAPFWCYWYARKVIKGRWLEMEHIVLTSSLYSYLYALNVINGRWEESKKVILTSQYYSYMYAIHVLKERWIDAEPLIFSNGFYKHLYCDHFNIIE